MRLIYHPDAETELTQAAEFYEKRVSGLGVEFLQAVERAISLIKEAPTRWRMGEGNVRRYLMPRFPYAIYYREFAEEVRILALKHHRRHPDYWRGRIA